MGVLLVFCLAWLACSEASGGAAAAGTESQGRSLATALLPSLIDAAVTRAPACRDPVGTTGYCLSRAGCRAQRGTAGAPCRKSGSTRGLCCLVDRCPVEPPVAPFGTVRDLVTRTSLAQALPEYKSQLNPGLTRALEPA
ncbi:uncharacterized protein LOC119113488 [Pollicipes pollicipes]|uniref:uncharacterized protein LOC119113488 n=1 Tax=Pollicipes pollicipes TaxID=41117 RepID=UPI001884A5B4|nr:uncharacterized protein LOC119113488 [Pollicipes pollicipes]